MSRETTVRKNQEEELDVEGTETGTRQRASDAPVSGLGLAGERILS